MPSTHRLVQQLLFVVKLPLHVLFHVQLVFRLFIRLLTHLFHGSGKWAFMALRLVAYVLLLLPAFVAMLRYWLFDPQVVKHVEYGQGEKQRNMLDIYLPRKLKLKRRGHTVEVEPEEQKLPVIVFFTGGAWIIGYKAWGALMAQSLTENGFVVVIPDYRNFPQATIGDMIEDARNALTWVFANIDKYGGNPDRVAVAGQSAGAHISACLMLDQLEQELKAKKHPPRKPFSWTLSQVSMYFGISGPYNLCTMEKYFDERGLDARILKWIMQSDLERFSPCNLPFRDDLLHLIREQGRDVPSHPVYVACKRAAASQGAELVQQPKNSALDEHESIGRLLPPVALFHGEIDKSVPYTVAVEFAENLKLAGVITHLRIYEHWSHTDPILEGPMGGDDSLCYDMMVAYSKVLKARALYESKRNGEDEEESKAALPQHADAVESAAEHATPAQQEAADPASTKSAKRKSKKKRQQHQHQHQAAAAGIIEQQAGDASTASILSEPESSAPPACSDNDISIVQALLEPASTLSGCADDVINVQTLASKRPPMASAFFIHVARYVNPF